MPLLADVVVFSTHVARYAANSAMAGMAVCRASTRGAEEIVG